MERNRCRARGEGEEGRAGGERKIEKRKGKEISERDK